MINQIGYTKDGLVFMVIDGEFDGKPFQTITQMTADSAAKVSSALITASRSAKEILGERDSANFN